MQKQWVNNYRSKTIIGFELLGETNNHPRSVFFTYRRTQTINHDTKVSHYSIAGQMPNDKGGCRPLMAASSQLGQQGGEPLVQKYKGVGFAAI